MLAALRRAIADLSESDFLIRKDIDLVKLFAADIRQIAPNAPKLIALLDRERQARVRALGDSRAALLSLAAGLLLYDAFGEGTRSVRFEHGRRGKPHLPDRTPFNITHAGDYAVLALSTQSVGVDLEQIRPIDWQKIANRFFIRKSGVTSRARRLPRRIFFASGR